MRLTTWEANMKKIFLCLILFSFTASAQVYQFYWKKDAAGKAIPYVPGINLNLDSAKVYSKDTVDAKIARQVPDTLTKFYSRHQADSLFALKVKYADTLTTIASRHYSDSSIFDPRTSYEFYEEFDASNGGSGNIGRTNFYSTGAANGQDTTSAGVYGAYCIKTSASSGNTAYIYNPAMGTTATLGAFLGTEKFTWIARVKIAADTQKSVFIGLTDNYDTPASYLGFWYTARVYGHGNWEAVTNRVGSGHATPQTNTLSTPDNAYHTFTINSTGTVVTYYIDNVLVATHSGVDAVANIPTMGMKYVFWIQTYSSVARKIAVDYVWCKMKGLSR